MSRSLLVILLLATMPILTNGATPIPLKGDWVFSAKMTGIFVQWQAEEPVVFRVPACANPITMYHPDLDNGSVVMFFTNDDQSYTGTGSWTDSDGNDGTIRVKLKAVSRKRMVGKLWLDPFHRSEDDGLIVDYKGAVPSPAVTAGSAALIPQDVKTEQAGLFREITLNGVLRLTEFGPNDDQLLPTHTNTIRGLYQHESSPPSLPLTEQYGRIMCDSYKHKFDKVYGYKDSGIERDNTPLPQDRADATVQELRRYWQDSPIGSQPGTPGTGSAAKCPRAAVADVEIVRSYYGPMYSREDTDKWLRKWMGGTRERRRDATPELRWRDNTDAARKFKMMYCAANGLLLMLEAGYCDVPSSSFAERVFKGRQFITQYDTGQRVESWDWKGAEGEIWGLYVDGRAMEGSRDQTMAQSGGYERPELLDKDNLTFTSADQLKRAAEISQRQYQFYATHCLEANKQRADEIELEFFDENTSWDTPDWTSFTPF